MTLVAPEDAAVTATTDPPAPAASATAAGADAKGPGRSVDPDTSAETAPAGSRPGGAGGAGADEVPEPLSPLSIGLAIAGWSVVLLLTVLSVAYPLGPLFQRREQHRLLSDFRTDVQQAADAEEGLAGLLDTEAPVAAAPGDAVAILELGGVRVQQVVVEGVDPSQTQVGPGHVPGTAGLGQPGNPVVVGRRATAGGPFAELSELREGDEIVATTTQGQSVYVVTSNRTATPDDSTYGPSEDDRLTLVTSASRRPWSAGPATIVTAQLQGRPFEPTPQGARSPEADGRRGASDVWPSIALFGIAFAATAALAGFLYRRWRPVTAYLLTTPALVVFAVLTAETLLELLPAWA